MKKAALLAIAALSLGTACQKSSTHWKNHAFSEQDLTREPVEARLPRGLWQKVSSVLVTPKGAEKAPQENETETVKGPLPSVFTPMKVYLVEKNRGILQRGNVAISFGPGGGEIDLKDYLHAKNGSFYFAVEFMPEVEKLERRVFFLSNSPVRSIGSGQKKETLGSGCDTYFDVTKAFKEAMRAEGFLVNTSDARHVGALAGTFFFAAANEGKLHLAALTIKDSSHRDLHCRK